MEGCIPCAPSKMISGLRARRFPSQEAATPAKWNMIRRQQTHGGFWEPWRVLWSLKPRALCKGRPFSVGWNKPHYEVQLFETDQTKPPFVWYRFVSKPGTPESDGWSLISLQHFSVWSMPWYAVQCLFLAFKQTRQMRQNQHATSASLQYHRFTSSTFKIFNSLRLPSASNKQNHQNPIILSWHWKSAVESGCPRCRTWDLSAHLGTMEPNS